MDATQTMTSAELLPEQKVTARKLDRILDGFEAVGARIAFLGRVLSIPLQTQADLQHALQCDAACDRSANPREARMREELRGLLVMRYEVVARMASSEQVGAPAARDILQTATDRLLAKGFDAQAPGMNLRPLFDGIED